MQLTGKKELGKNKLIMRLSFALVLVSFILLTCKKSIDNKNLPNDKKKLDVQKEFFADSTIAQETVHLNDTLVSNKKYYPNGQLKLISSFRNDKKHGRELAYYESGKIKYSVYFNTGKKDSIAYWFYESGVLEERESWDEGVLFGSQYKYDKTGKISGYAFSNASGKTIFLRSYDSSGTYSQEGRLMFILNKDVNLSIRDEVEFYIFPVSPDNFKINIIIEDLDSQKKIIRTTNVTRGDLGSVYCGLNFFYKTSFTKAGTYIVRIKVYLIDETNGKKYADATETFYFISEK
jgi:hypothetical protein